MRPLVAKAVYEERRRAGYAALNAAVKLLEDPPGVDVLLKFMAEPFHIKAQHRRVSDQICVFQGVLVLEKRVVHAPKFALRACSLSGLGRVLCVWVNFDKREIAKGEPKVISGQLYK